jgi:hypothetical protein
MDGERVLSAIEEVGWVGIMEHLRTSSKWLP